jgi:broad specificity phosphatase PhoE
MKITFIRHSKTEFNPDIRKICWGLTDEGIELAKNLAHEKVIKDLNVIYSSSEIKALETAIYLAKPNGIPIKTDFRLIEITSITNGLFIDFEKSAKDYFEDRVERWNNGETKSEALKRFKEALIDIIEIERNAGNHNIGIVSHGSIYTLFTAEHYNIPIWDIFNLITMPDIAEYDWEAQKFTVLWKNLRV